jgi:zinc transport system permease protein
VSLVCYFLGLVISYVRNVPTGASVVILNIITFLLFSCIKFLDVRVKRRRPENIKN